MSSRQVCWAQELSCYHFCIDYCQGKANKATDALSRYFQRSQSEEEILQAENTRVFQCLKSLLTHARASSTPPAHVASLKHVIICGTHALPDLCQSWETFRHKLAAEAPYQASIEGMRLRLVELQVEDSQVRKIRAEKLGGNWEDTNRILHYQGLPYVLEIIRTELISRHHNDPVAGHFGIEKTQELVARK